MAATAPAAARALVVTVAWHHAHRVEARAPRGGPRDLTLALVFRWPVNGISTSVLYITYAACVPPIGPDLDRNDASANRSRRPHPSSHALGFWPARCSRVAGSSPSVVRRPFTSCSSPAVALQHPRPVLPAAATAVVPVTRRVVF